MQNRHHFLPSFHNTQIHMSMKTLFKFFIVKVISSVVNMTSEKYNVLEASICLQSKIKGHWVRNGLYGYVQVEFLNFLRRHFNLLSEVCVREPIKIHIHPVLKLLIRHEEGIYIAIMITM